MTALLWTKWYFPDWTNDPGLRASSLAARGLWMDMLCVAARHDPPGYVAINGNPISPGTLARMVGASVQDVESLLDELERNGVFSRNRTGIIYSRRMVRENKAAKTARENGKKGGNPSLCKTRGFSGWDNPPLNLPLNTHKPEASKPEAREEILSPSFHSGESEARPPEKPPRKLKSSTPNRTRIDPEAVDGPAEYAEFEKSGLPMADLERVWLNFRDHHASKGSLMADWLAAWRTWLRREVEFRSRNAGSAQPFPFGKPEKRVLQ